MARRERWQGRNQHRFATAGDFASAFEMVGRANEI
jgi:hypothetical protein